MLLTDARGNSCFVFEPLLHAAVQFPAKMKKAKQRKSKKICALLDEQTKASVRNLLFGPKVLEELKILARIAKAKSGASSKPRAAKEKASESDDERLAA